MVRQYWRGLRGDRPDSAARWPHRETAGGGFSETLADAATAAAHHVALPPDRVHQHPGRRLAGAVRDASSDEQVFSVTQRAGRVQRDIRKLLNRQQ